MDIYTRLYTYRETPSVSPLENFLTEALADIFNRLPAPLQTEFLVWMLPEHCAGQARSKCEASKLIDANTQVSIVVADSVKRPDIIIYLDGKPFVVVEVKVKARIQQHRVGDIDAKRSFNDDSEAVFQSQLETYRSWIATKQKPGWPGAVVLLTHGTHTPEWSGHDEKRSDGVISVTRTWRGVGGWLGKKLALSQLNATHCALASDFKTFLERRGMMTEFLSSRDLAATALFVPAQRALDHTFRTVIEAVAARHPKSRGG